MNITINVVTETQLEGERIRRFKGTDAGVILKEVQDYLGYVAPVEKKVSPAQDMGPKTEVKAQPKSEPKPQPKMVHSKAKKR